jgi:hypothetical protein
MEVVRPLFCNEINLNDIIYSDVYNDRNGKKCIYIYHKKQGNKLYIQTPELKNIINIIKSDNYYELDLPLYGKKKEKVDTFVNFLNDLDTKLIQDAKKYKNVWFKNNKNIKYRSLIKNIHNDYSETIENKLGIFDNGIIKFKITNSTSIVCNKKQIDVSNIKVGTNIRTIFQVFAIWISNDFFGLYLKPSKVEQIYNQVIEFIDVSEDESVYNTDDDDIVENNIIFKESETITQTYKEKSETEEYTCTETETQTQNKQSENECSEIYSRHERINDIENFDFLKPKVDDFIQDKLLEKLTRYDEEILE